MEIVKYGGALAQIVEAVANAGSPPDIQRIVVTPEEMDEIWKSNAFKTSISNYYGDTSAMTLEGITADHDGNIISMYLGGVLICVGPWEPSGAYALLTWGPLVTQTGAATTFKNESGYLYAGTDTSGTGMVVGANADLELALAVRKAGDPASYATGANYNIEIADDEAWTFVVSVGSKNGAIYNPLDMYNVRLIVDTDPDGSQNSQLVFTLGQGEIVERGVKRNGFIWYRDTVRAITDSATSPMFNAEGAPIGFATQTIQQMRFEHIRRYVETVEKTANGSFLGTYTLTLEATPKFGSKTADVVSVQAVANVVKKS